MDLLHVFIVLEPFGHFVVSKVVQEVQLLKISNDPKQRKSVTIKPSHKHFWQFSVRLPWQYYFNKRYTLMLVLKGQMNAYVTCRIKAKFKCSMKNFEFIQPATSACTFW